MAKNRAAAELGKRRWRNVKPEARTAHAKHAVEVRENLRQARKATMQQELMEAHIPTWLKIQLADARTGGRAPGHSYVDAGYHLGRYHIDDFCEDPDLLDPDVNEAETQPTRVLRRIFRSEEHPRGELTDFVPPKHRRDFLIGLLAGAAEEDPGDYWLSLLEKE
jgi:hypothetical protein